MMREPTGNLTQWISGAFVVAAALLVFTPSPEAIPAFARKYNVKCYTCHTIFPRLNKLGYEFKRLGYRMPPDIEEGKAPKAVKELDEKIPFTLTNAVSVFARTSISHDMATEGGTSKGTGSINLEEVAILFGGAVPQTNFSYFGEFLAYEDGNSSLEHLRVFWTGGTVKHSYFGEIGKGPVLEGYLASDKMGLTDDDNPLAFGIASPNGIVLDPKPGLVGGGYTYMSPDYKYVFGLTAKVTNGLDVNGEEIGSGSSYNHKDVALSADFLIGDHAAVSALYYNGRKDTIQNAGSPLEFTYVPTATRWGLFASARSVFDHLDVLAGYIGGREDWKNFSWTPETQFNSRSYFVEADYYIAQGFAVYGRYDRASFDSPAYGLSTLHTRSWKAGIIKSVVKRGFAKVYAQFSDERGNDFTGFVTDGRQAKIGLDLAW